MLVAFSDLTVDSIPVEGYEAPEPVEKEKEVAVEKEVDEYGDEIEPEPEEVDELPEEVRLASGIKVSLQAAEGVDPETYDFEFSLFDP